MEPYNDHYKWLIGNWCGQASLYPCPKSGRKHIRHFINCFSRITKTCVITTTEGIIYKTVMCKSYLHNYWRRGSSNSKLTGNVRCGTINRRFLQRWPTINNFGFFDLLKRLHERRVFKQQINNDDFAEYFNFKNGHVPWEFKSC